MSGKVEYLGLTTWLHAIDEHQTVAREHLIAQGFHPKVIYSKAEKSARRGYTDYGVAADRPWLTAKGVAWLTDRGITLTEHPPFRPEDIFITIRSLAAAMADLPLEVRYVDGRS